MRTSIRLGAVTLMICWLVQGVALGALEVVDTTTSFDSVKTDPTHVISNFTVATGDDRKLVLLVSWEGVSTISATYGAQSFAVAENSAGGRNSAILYLDDPQVGTQDITVTFGVDTGSRIGVMSLRNAEPGAVITSTNTGSSGSIAPTTNGSLVVGVYTSNGDNAGITSAFPNSIYNGSSSSSSGEGGYQDGVSQGSATYTWTVVTPSSDNHALAVFQEVGAVPPAWTTLVATSISTDSATITANCLQNLDQTMLYWDTADRGLSAGNWTGGSDNLLAKTAGTAIVGQASGLSADNTYYARFLGVHSSDSWSEVLTFSTNLTSSQAPAFSANTATGTTITLNWQDRSSTESSFVLQRSLGGTGNYLTIATLAAGTVTFTDTGLSGNTTYDYRLAAINGDNDSSTGFDNCTLSVSTEYLSTTDVRLRQMMQTNIDSPWPSIADPNNSPGVFSYALACLYLDQNVAQANQLLIDFYTNNPIPPKTSNARDTYNGYFYQHVLWRLFHDPTASSRLTTQAKELLEDNMWTWINTRSKLSEAQQDEWIIHDSENHDAMQKGSNMMTLLALKKSTRYSNDLVLANGGTLQQHLDAWTDFYIRYFRARAMEGINVEIACQQYAKYTMGAYYNIMDFTDNTKLKSLAKTFIDLYWADTASDYISSGVRGGGQTRCYKEGNYLKRGTTYSFHSLLWGYGWHSNPGTVRIYGLIKAVSSYRIPDIITACATDLNRPGFLYSSRRFGRGGSWTSDRDYTVVFDNGNSNLRRDTYVTPDYTMGTFTLDMNKQYIALIDQNRVMGIMFNTHPNDRIMVFGKGGASDTTKSFADISGVTRENCMIVQRDKNASSHGSATQLFLSQSAWDNRVETGDWLFTQLGDAYCALRPAGGGYTSEAVGSGINLTIGDMWAPVIIQTGQADDYADFTAFQTSVLANSLTYASGTMNYTSEAGDTFTFYANSKTTPKVNGSTVNLNPTKTYDSPYLSMVHGEDVATFTYGGYADLVMDFGYDPDISSLSPADDSSDVAIDTNLVATFNESVQAGSGNVTIRRTSDDSTVEVFDVGNPAEVTFSGSEITINPSSNFSYSTQYYITIDPTAVEDSSGNPFSGYTSSANWNFTTLVDVDPEVITLSPSNGATGVASDTNLVVNFSESIQAGSGIISLKRSSDDSVVENFDVTNPAEVNISGTQLTINPTADLDSNTQYYVTIAASAIEDINGNSYAGLTSSSNWSFTTLRISAIQVVNTDSKIVSSKISGGSATLSFDAGSSANMLVVAISTERSSEGPYTVTYGGETMSESVGSIQASIYHLDLDSVGYLGGANDLIVDFTGIGTVNGVGIGAVSLRSNSGNAIQLHNTSIGAAGAVNVLLQTTEDDTFNMVSFNGNDDGSTPVLNSPLTTIYTAQNSGSAQAATGYESGTSVGDHDYSWNGNNPRKVVAASFFVASSPNTAPTPISANVSTSEDVAVSITLSGSDVEGDLLSFSVVTQPSSGNLSGTAPNLTYTPHLNFFGSDNFEFSVNDGTEDSATNGLISLTVNPVNDQPTAIAQTVSTSINTAKSVTLSGNDLDGDALNFTVVSVPSNGNLSGTLPNLTYTPNPSFLGTDVFSFIVGDGNLTSPSANVEITVLPVNHAPVANNQSLSTDEDTSLNITLSGNDIDGDNLSYSVVISTGNGSLSGTAPHLSYSPEADFFGTDFLSFTVSDGNITSPSANIEITIDPVNDAPVALAQSISTNQDTPSAITLSGNDVDGDILSYAVVSGPSSGNLSGVAPNLTYTPHVGFSGSDVFSFTVSDGNITSASSNIEITVGNLVDSRLLQMMQENVDSPFPATTTAWGMAASALARLYMNQQVDSANNLILSFHNDYGVPNDDSISFDAYFPLHLIWRIYADPVMNSRLSTEARDAIEVMMWNFINHRCHYSETQGSVWDIHDTENHHAMQIGGFLIATQSLKNAGAPYGPNRTLADGYTLEQHANAWNEYWIKYFNARAKEGINCEIASPIYAKYSIGSYYNVRDFAESPILRDTAENFLNLYWADTAMDWVSSGVRGGAEARSYKEKYMTLGAFYSFHEFLWGAGWHDTPGTVRTYAMIPAVSSYRIPDIITACAQDNNRPNYLYSSRRFGLGYSNVGIAHHVEFDGGDSHLLRETYVTPDYAMGTFTIDMNKGYVKINEQNRAMGVKFSSGVNDRVIVNGLGRSNNNKSYAAITGVTRENCMVVQRDKNAYDSGSGTLVFISAGTLMDNRVERNGWFFTQTGSAYCAIMIPGGYSIDSHKSNSTGTVYSGNALVANDMWAPIVVQTGQSADYANFTDFQDSVIANTLSYDGSKTLTYTSENGDSFQLYGNTKTMPKVNGLAVNLNPTKTYDSPYLSMVHGEEIATFSYTGYSNLIMDFGQDPEIASLSPADDGTGISIDSNLVATFNEAVQAGTGNITLKRLSDNAIVEQFDVTNTTKVSFSGTQLTVNPTNNLGSLASYYVNIDAGAVEDVAGNPFAGMSSSTNWNFTTSNADTITVVNTGSKIQPSSLGGSTSTYSFDAGASANMLIVATSTERSSETGYTVTYDGHALTEAVGSIQASIWYLDLSSVAYSGGAADIVVDFAGIATVNGLGLGAISIRTAGGNPIQPHSTAASLAGADNLLIETTRDEAFTVVSFNANGDAQPVTVNAPLTTIYSGTNIGSAQGAAGYETDVASGNQSYSWSVDIPRKVVAASFIVLATNAAPTPISDAFSTPEDTPLGITLSGSDTDGDALSYTLTRQPSSGNLSGTAPNLTYTPDSNFFGSDNFEFSVHDGRVGSSSNGLISITVNGVNDAPVADFKSVSTNEDTPRAILLTGSDIEGDVLSFNVTASTNYGILSGTAPNLIYTPNANFNGSDAFTFTVNDGNATSSPATVTISVNAINDAPVAMSQSVSTDEDVAIGITLSGTDTEGSSLSYMITANPSNGSLSGTAPNLTYTPDANFNGSDVFSFTVSDGSLTSVAANVAITVTAVNDVPVATSQTVSTDEDVALGITLSGTDTEGSILSYTITANPSNGSLSGTAPNLTYTPDANFNGSDVFSFTVSDGSLTSVTANVAISVAAVNDAPVATSQAVSTDEDVALGITLSGTDTEGSILSYTITANPSNGSLSGTAPNLTYTPEANFNGSDVFSFTVSDGSLTSVAANVAISVTAVNDVPVATSQSVSTDEDVALGITLSGTDTEGSSLSYAITANPSNGSLSGTAPNLTYTPEANFNGSDVFSFTVSDGSLTSVAANVDISVTAVNDVPVATTQSVSTDEDVAVEIALSGTDLDGDSLSYTMTSGPTHGSLTGAAPNLTYTPEPNFEGSDSFSFTVNDGSVTSVSASVNITVNGVNDTPVASAQSLSLDEDTSLVITLSGTDVEGDSLSYVVTSGPSHGSLSGTGSNLNYTPDSDFAGSDSFSFTVNDGSATSSSATVELTVNAVNDAPVAQSQSLGTLENAALAITLFGSDIDGDALSYDIISAPSKGSLSGTIPNLTYTPDTDYSGNDSFTFSVSDGTETSSVAVVSISVSALSEGPRAQAQAVELDEDSNVSITLSGTDPEGDVLSYQVTQQPSHGVLSGTAPNYVYTPNQDYFGQDLFLFSVSDGITVSPSANVVITILAVNDRPVTTSANLQTNEDVTLGFTLSGNDIEASDLSFTITRFPENGQLLGTAPDFSFQPDADFFGEDSFEFIVSDGSLDSPSATVFLTVAAINDSPVALAQDASTQEDESLVITVSAEDIEGDPLSYEIVVDPSHGTLSGNGPEWTYEPNENFFGSDNFLFSVSDGSLSSNALVEITVDSVNDAPSVLVSSDVMALDVNASSNLTLHATDPDSLSLTYLWRMISGPSGVVFTDSDASMSGVSFLQSGNYEIQALVSDEEFQIASASLFFQVSENTNEDVTDPPTVGDTEVVDQPGDLPLLAGSSVMFSFQMPVVSDEGSNSVKNISNYLISGEAYANAPGFTIEGEGSGPYTLSFDEPLRDGDLVIEIFNVEDQNGDLIEHSTLNRSVEAIQFIRNPVLREGTPYELLMRAQAEIEDIEDSTGSIYDPNVHWSKVLKAGTARLTLGASNGSSKEISVTVEPPVIQDFSDTFPAYGQRKVFSLVNFPINVWTFSELKNHIEEQWGNMGPTNWVIYAYPGKDGETYSIPDDDDVSGPTVSYWLATVEERELDLSTFGPAEGDLVTRSLLPGWNLMGNPYSVPVSVDKFLVQQDGELVPFSSEEQTTLHKTVFTLNEDMTGYAEPEELGVGLGAWVYNLSESPVVIAIDPSMDVVAQFQKARESYTISPPSIPGAEADSEMVSSSEGLIAPAGAGGGGGCLLR